VLGFFYTASDGKRGFHALPPLLSQPFCATLSPPFLQNTTLSPPLAPRCACPQSLRARITSLSQPNPTLRFVGFSFSQAGPNGALYYSY
jgi:hypothetical protein